MRQTSTWTLCVLQAMALATLCSLAADQAQAQVTKPFMVTGGGVAPEGLRPPGEVTTHLIEGHATHMGDLSGEGDFDIYSLAPDSPSSLVGTFGSHDPCVFVAANGDELVCYYGRTDKGAAEVGTFAINILDITAEGLIVEALFIAEFVPQPECTGKFAGVTGGWIMYAQTEPFILGSDDPVNYYWEGDGELTFAKPQAQ